MLEVQKTGVVTNRWCHVRFRVVYNTAYRDVQALVALSLLKPVGSGRNGKYVPAAPV